VSASPKHHNRGSSHSSQSAGSGSESSQRGAETGEAVAEEPREQRRHATSKRKKRRLLQRVTKQAVKVAEAAGLPEVAIAVQKYNPAHRVSALKQPEAVDQQRKVTFQPAHAEKAPPSSQRARTVHTPKGKGKGKKGPPHQQRQLPGKGGKGKSRKGFGGCKDKQKKKGAKGAGGSEAKS